MFSPFEGGQGDEFIVEKTEFLLFKIKIIPLAPFKRGKLLPILKFSVNFEIKRYLVHLCIPGSFWKTGSSLQSQPPNRYEKNNR
jgi:hypothetical protein